MAAVVPAVLAEKGGLRRDPRGEGGNSLVVSQTSAEAQVRSEKPIRFGATSFEAAGESSVKPEETATGLPPHVVLRGLAARTVRNTVFDPVVGFLVPPVS